MKNRFFITQITTLILLFSFSACTSTPKVTPEQLYWDIENVKIELSNPALEDVYNPVPLEELQKDILDGKVNRNECVNRLEEILNSYNIVHLCIQRNFSTDGFDEFLPILLKCFGNEYYVIGAISPYAKYNGWKVLAINDVPCMEAVQEIGKLMNYETYAGRKYSLQIHQNKNALSRPGYVNKNQNVRFTFESADGITETCYIPFITEVQTPVFYDIPKEDPLMNNTNKCYSTKYDEKTNTLYLHFNKFESDEDIIWGTFFNDFFEDIKSHDYKTIVIDLSHNVGGELYMAYGISSMFYANKEKINRSNLAIIISGQTYSAATFFLNDLIRTFPNAVLFGEETGQAVVNYTLIRPHHLKNLDVDFSCPYLVQQSEELMKRSSDYTKGTMPDVEVYRTYEDAKNGINTIYVEIEKYFSTK